MIGGRLLFCLLLGATFGSCQRDAERLTATAGGGVQLLCSDMLQAQEHQLLQAGRAVVTRPIADLCGRPPCLAGLTDQARLGDVVKVLPGEVPDCVHSGNAFLQIETESSYRAFINIENLRALAPAEPAYGDSGPLLRVTSRLASVYAQSDVTKGKPIVQLPVDLRLRVVAPVDERWLKVLLPDGVSGFVQRGDVAELAAAAPPISPSCVIDHARLYEGTPYLWGGRSTLGIDCSGLVSNAFIACGVVPPRDASPQAGWSQLTVLPLSPDSLLPGDLLFFGQPRKDAASVPKVKITHVGIYVGDGRFIHATTHERPMVQESALSDPHWTELWVGARRYPFPQ